MCEEHSSVAAKCSADFSGAKQLSWSFSRLKVFGLKLILKMHFSSLHLRQLLTDGGLARSKMLNARPLSAPRPGALFGYSHTLQLIYADE